jgi:hypothetical protein
MTSMKEVPGEEPVIYKTDSLQRVRVPRERQEAILDEFERSGASGMRFAAYAGIKYATFANWVGRRKRERAGAGSEPSRVLKLVEAVVEDRAVRPLGVELKLRVQLPGGAYLELGNLEEVKLAAQLLTHLSPC